MKRNRFKLFAPIALSIVLVISCTNLEIEETDSNFPEETGGGFSGVGDPASQVDGLYNDLNGHFGDQANYFALTEVSTDEQLVPTRGTDWGDNGIWRTLHQHTWDASHQYILTTWNQFNQNVFRASEVIETTTTTAEVKAQAQFIRGLSMWVIMDLFGQVPFREVDEGPEINPRVLSRSEALDFVVTDLEAAIAGLPSAAAPSSEDNARASKAAARFLLARVLLNKHIYNGSGTPDSADMNSVISLVDQIAAEGYELQEGYFDIFRESGDTETIWYLPTSVGNRIFNGLHYNSTELSGGGWNGFSTLAEFYDMFEGDANSNRGELDGTPLDGQEERRGWVPSAGTPFTGAEGTKDDNSDGYEDGSNVGLGFLIGQQYKPNGEILKDRPGNNLAFTKEFPGLVGNNERTGIRVQKYAARYGEFLSHEIIFRYADAHLMKAEAMMRSGGDPTAMVNELRTLRGATPLGTVSEADLLAERGRELYVEFVRRNDMIRFGQFTRDWEFKDPGSVGDETKLLFPIPNTALLSNPNLVQNPGY